jgi:hypothetical protein
MKCCTTSIQEASIFANFSLWTAFGLPRVAPVPPGLCGKGSTRTQAPRLWLSTPPWLCLHLTLFDGCRGHTGSWCFYCNVYSAIAHCGTLRQNNWCCAIVHCVRQLLPLRIVYIMCCHWGLCTSCVAIKDLCTSCVTIEDCVLCLQCIAYCGALQQYQWSIIIVECVHCILNWALNAKSTRDDVRAATWMSQVLSSVGFTLIMTGPVCKGFLQCSHDAQVYLTLRSTRKFSLCVSTMLHYWLYNVVLLILQWNIGGSAM